MAGAILDSSAILAMIFVERGASVLTPEILANSAVSTVNLAEIQAKLVGRGYLPEHAWTDALSVANKVEIFTPEQARIAGTLIRETRGLGLSLGDRACLALAMVLRAPVYTADQGWADLQIGVEIHVLR